MTTDLASTKLAGPQAEAKEEVIRSFSDPEACTSKQCHRVWPGNNVPRARTGEAERPQLVGAAQTPPATLTDREDRARHDRQAEAQRVDADPLVSSHDKASPLRPELADQSGRLRHGIV
ncbi:MAG TPA: hypothetical protein VGF67_14870 [Ktedonobacteraceae bacterium]